MKQMSSEPKLETFISRIKKADLQLEELYNNPDNLKELLWFFDEERGNEVAQKIYEEEVNVHAAIVKNLARLYPLSKHVLHAFYQQDAKETDADFIDVLKESADIVASVKHVISRIEVEKPNITTTFQDYKKRVESLYKEIEEKQASLKDLAVQKEEVTRLQDELDKISKEISALKNTDIDELKKKKTAKDNELKRLKSEKEKLGGDIDKIEKQLQAEKENIGDEQIIAKLRELSKMLPAGVEY